MPRPSAAGTDGYDATSSGGSNYGPTNQKLIDRVKALGQIPEGKSRFHRPHSGRSVTASASGLDPHISPANAQMAQAARVAAARHLDAKTVQELVDRHTQPRTLGFLGEPAVNVLELNLELDRRQAR